MDERHGGAGGRGPSRIQWLRGGSSPETLDVTFELSTNGGSTWTMQGAGIRITGGWELTNLTLTASGHVRARARIDAGNGEGSWSSLLETVISFSATPQQLCRYSYFGTYENTGAAADNADPDGDGLENLMEFAFGRHPRKANPNAMPAWQLSDDDYMLTFTQPAGVSGITYHAESSTSLTPGSWTAIPNSGAAPNYLYYAPAVSQRLYLRLRVTVP